MAKTVRVTSQGKKWQVKTDGADRAAKLTDKKEDAVKAAKQIAKNQKAELIIQGKDGKIQSKDSYGRDPNPPKDTEH
ncbi:MAG: DUF2188 domain-containing protein [Chlorobia bacterium]|nr:DUF2188 domain-containing protein [Fimbriimonadaceae bacterium]